MGTVGTPSVACVVTVLLATGRGEAGCESSGHRLVWCFSFDATFYNGFLTSTLLLDGGRDNSSKDELLI